MTDVTALVNYYENLLIIQYHDKPKAQAFINTLVTELMASGIFFDVQNGYSVETAVGVQLDIVGKYVGVDRFYLGQDLVNLFGFTDYVEVSPDSVEKWGFTDYADFDTQDQFNGVLNYNSVLSQTFALNDDDYRTLIKLKIYQNNINHSIGAINNAIFDIFGADVIPSSNGNMHMVYIVPNSLTAIIQAALTKHILLVPIGVQLSIIQNAPDVYFGFATYVNQPAAITGFTTYATYATKVGETLTYDQITPEGE